VKQHQVQVQTEEAKMDVEEVEEAKMDVEDGCTSMKPHLINLNLDTKRDLILTNS
jgi:hypothetical protein